MKRAFCVILAVLLLVLALVACGKRNKHPIPTTAPGGTTVTTAPSKGGTSATLPQGELPWDEF